MSILRSCLLCSAAALALSVSLPAAAMPPAEAPSIHVMEIQEELGSLQQRLASIEEQALQDPEIQAAQRDLQQKVEAAVAKEDPEFQTKVTRLGELQAAYQQARAAGNEARMQEIMTEGQGLEKQLDAAQAKVLQIAQITSGVEAFQDKVRKKMAQIEPETETMIERTTTLISRLQATHPPRR